MALNRPRRIFRGSLFDVPAFGDKLRRLMLVGMAGAGIGAGAVLFGHASNLFGQAPAPPGAVTAEPLLVAVVDGATLRLHDMVVQLHGVVAPARGRSCPDGQGSFYDCGAAASAALANLVRDHRVACRLSGFDRRRPGPGRLRGGRQGDQSRPCGFRLGARRRPCPGRHGSGGAGGPARVVAQRGQSGLLTNSGFRKVLPAAFPCRLRSVLLQARRLRACPLRPSIQGCRSGGRIAPPPTPTR